MACIEKPRKRGEAGWIRWSNGETKLKSFCHEPGFRPQLSSMPTSAGANTACVSTGVDVNPEHLSNFLFGFSSVDDVTSQHGTLTSRTTLRKRSTILVYSLATSMPHPESLISIHWPVVCRR
jgi:hypothetical protein